MLWFCFHYVLNCARRTSYKVSNEPTQRWEGPPCSVSASRNTEHSDEAQQPPTQSMTRPVSRVKISTGVSGFLVENTEEAHDTWNNWLKFQIKSHVTSNYFLGNFVFIFFLKTRHVSLLFALRFETVFVELQFYKPVVCFVFSLSSIAKRQAQTLVQSPMQYAHIFVRFNKRWEELVFNLWNNLSSATQIQID